MADSQKDDLKALDETDGKKPKTGSQDAIEAALKERLNGGRISVRRITGPIKGKK